MSLTVGNDPAVAAAAAMRTASAATAAREISTRLSRLAAELEAAATAWPSQPVSGWRGAAADAALEAFAVRPQRFRAAATACRGAAAALTRHAEALGSAVALYRQAEQGPADLAPARQRQAADLAAETARLTAAALTTLAGSAPPPSRSPWSDWSGRLDTWRGELQLGAVESTAALAATAGQVAARLLNPFDTEAPDELRRFGSGALAAARHPLDLAKSVLDWDTWSARPARAVGHLLPDLVASVVSAGTATTARTVTAAGRTRSAVQAAAVRDRLRREANGAAAIASRQALVRRAQVGEAGEATGWLGPGGTRLTPRQNANAEAFHALSAADEPAVTAAMRAAVLAGRGRLAGLDQRLKPAESYKRKLAAKQARTGRPLPDLLAGTQDAMRYTAVLDDAHYVRGVAEIAAALERRGFHPQATHNAWHGPRYRGINSHWLDPATGAAFEVQFHTPASWRITKQTHELYEEYRLPSTPAARKAELHELIATQYRQAPIPGWVHTLTEATFPPRSRPDPIVPPTDYTLPAAAIAAGTVELGTIAPRVQGQGHIVNEPGHS